MTGRIKEEPNGCAEDDIVFDDYLTWSKCARVAGVKEERLNMRSRMRPLGRATS